MLPAQWRQVLQQRLIDGMAVATQGMRCALQVDCVPQHDTRAGLDVARQLGRKGGRKPKMTDSKIASAKKLLAGGVPARDVAKNLGVSVPTLYRWVPATTHVSSAEF